MSPQETMEEVLEFLGEPWDDQVLHHEKVNRGFEPEESSTDQVEQEVHTNALEKWKKEFSAEDKKKFKEIAGELLIDLGYEEDLNW